MLTTVLTNQRTVPDGQRPADEYGKCRTPLKTVLLALILTTVCLQTTAADAPADRFAGQIRKYKASAESARFRLAELMIELNQVPAFSTVDGPLIKRNLAAISQAWTEAVAALEKGDETTAAALSKRAQEIEGNRDRWKERLRWRALQAQRGEYLPATAEIHTLLAKDRKAEDLKEMEAFLEAKKRRSEAYGRLAEATTPTADPQTLYKLQDEMFTNDVEVGVADMKYTWSRDDWNFRTWVATDPRITSPELATAKDQLAAWRTQREDIYRQSRNQQHALKQLDREKDAVLDAREKAYRAAKAAQELPRNGK